MARREVYGTTGTRMGVRFFGGWDFTDEDLNSRQPAFLGYEKGVPMGGDMRPRQGGGSPTFMVYALRDPIGANLDRIQIVKGWLDADGQTHERVYDVAWSEGRSIDGNGDLPPVGNTVDVANANWTNTIGASELGTVWTDPDFDPDESAFYYARVIEIPTPRWVVYDAFRFGVEIPEGAETVHQERAYTSPIWYSPGGLKQGRAAPVGAAVFSARPDVVEYGAGQPPPRRETASRASITAPSRSSAGAVRVRNVRYASSAFSVSPMASYVRPRWNLISERPLLRETPSSARTARS